MSRIHDVNAHLHTPYSFSAFSSVTQALDMAAEEGVKVVGINDFYSMDGYGEWKEECGKRRLFPLFNIEFISLNAEDQAAGLRVNDPNNPGRTYISGKGLAYPIVLKGEEARQLAAVKAESNAQVERMCAKLNDHLDAVEAGFRISFDEVREQLTRGSIRERHLATAVRLLRAHWQRPSVLPWMPAPAAKSASWICTRRFSPACRRKRASPIRLPWRTRSAAAS